MWYLTTTTVTAENGESRTTYGIKRGSTVINDVSLNKTDMENFVETLNLHDVSEAHGYEVVEDFLGK